MSEKPKYQIKADVVDEGQTLELVIEAEEQNCRLRLPASAVDALIAGLGQQRELMTPSVPHDPPFREQRPFLSNPRWYSEYDAMHRASALMIRHPGFGWLGALLPPISAEKLGEYLREQAEQAEKAAPDQPN